MYTPPDSLSSSQVPARGDTQQSKPAGSIQGRNITPVTPPIDIPRRINMHTLLTEEFLKRPQTAREARRLEREIPSAQRSLEIINVKEQQKAPAENRGQTSDDGKEKEIGESGKPKDKFKGINPREALRKSRSNEGAMRYKPESSTSFSTFADFNFPAGLDLQSTKAIATRKKKPAETKEKGLNFASASSSHKGAKSSQRICQLNLQSILPEERYPFSAREAGTHPVRDAQPEIAPIKRKKTRKKAGKEKPSQIAKDKFQGCSTREALKSIDSPKTLSNFTGFNAPEADLGVQEKEACHPARKKSGSLIGFFNFSSLKSSSEEKVKKKAEKRRSRTLSAKSKKIPLHSISEKSVRHLARNLLIAFNSLVDTPDPYNLLKHKPFKQYKDELKFAIFRLAIDAKREEVPLLAWEKLRGKNGYLLAGTRARIKKMQKTLENNFGPKEAKSPREKREFIDSLKGSLANLLAQKTVGNFLEAYQRLPSSIVEFATHIIHPNVILRLKKFQDIEPSKKFLKTFEEMLVLVHNLRNIQKNIFFKVVPEKDSSICRISCEDIKRTYTSHMKAFNFREVVLEKQEGDMRIGKDSGSAKCMSIPESSEFETAEEYAIELFRFLINKIIQAEIHFTLPAETIQFIAEEIAKGLPKTLQDCDIPNLSSDCSYSESEDTLSDSERKKIYIMKILQTTSFANSNYFTLDFIERYSGIFNLNQKMNYLGPFKEEFDARFSGAPGSRALRLGATSIGFYTDQIMELNTSYNDKAFITFQALGRTEYDWKLEEFTLHGIKLVLDEESLLQLVQHSGNPDGKWTFKQLRIALEKIIVVMRYMSGDELLEFAHPHAKNMLMGLGNISDDDLLDSYPSLSIPTMPEQKKRDGITRDDTDDELQSDEEWEGKGS